jgi:hypothetical protein
MYLYDPVPGGDGIDRQPDLQAMPGQVAIQRLRLEEPRHDPPRERRTPPEELLDLAAVQRPTHGGEQVRREGSLRDRVGVRRADAVRLPGKDRLHEASQSFGCQADQAGIHQGADRGAETVRDSQRADDGPRAAGRSGDPDAAHRRTGAAVSQPALDGIQRLVPKSGLDDDDAALPVRERGCQSCRHRLDDASHTAGLVQGADPHQNL